LGWRMCAKTKLFRPFFICHLRDFAWGRVRS